MTDQTSTHRAPGQPLLGCAPCLVCGSSPEPVRDDLLDQPHGALSFSSSGHYGATCFDPMPEFGGPVESLRINVCAKCLHRAADKGRVVVTGDGERRVWPRAIDEHSHGGSGVEGPCADDVDWAGSRR